jgi:transmembrane 9 superfamily member 2/4
VYWKESEIEWASRWDAYLSMPNGSVHWFSILNSLLVVLVMSVIVAVILMRTVRRDLAKYEELLVEGQVRNAMLCVPRSPPFAAWNVE